MTEVTIDHDLHVHTFLSSCSDDPQAVPEKMIAQAARSGLKTVGFADHLWDKNAPGASEWYRPQDFEHISQIRAQLPAANHGIRVLIGAETEYIGQGKVGITPEVATQLDFVLVPMSHFHMEGFVRPAEIHQPSEVAGLMRDRFAEVVELEVATGIAHPFLPCGFTDHTDEIIGALSDAELTDLCGGAAEKGISLEITIGAFPSLNQGETEGFHDETFLRVYRLALQSGCVFHCASDTHSLARMGYVRRLEPFIHQLGLTEENFHPLVRAS